MSDEDGSPRNLPDADPSDHQAGQASQPTSAAGGPIDATGPIERSAGGRVFAHRFQLLGRRGTATDVALFEAHDIVTDRAVAVKIIHPDICARPGFEERFHETMAQVLTARHPNLTEVIETGTATWSGRTVYFVVCENLAGGSLRDLRDRGRQLSPSQVVMIGLDVCRGLDAAHRLGLVHGDIRPANLVFGIDGRLRLADVGLAQLVSDAWWVEPTGVNIEKAKFASPEQAKGLEPTTKSDVYALCLCLLEAVTGQLPFVGDSSVATLSNRVDKLMPVSADLGPLAAVLERAGRPDGDDRSSAAEFGRALHQAAEKLPRPAPLALVGGGLFASAPAGPDPTSPTGMLRRSVTQVSEAPVSEAPVSEASVSDPGDADGGSEADRPDVSDGVAPKPWLPDPARGSSSPSSSSSAVNVAPTDAPPVTPPGAVSGVCADGITDATHATHATDLTEGPVALAGADVGIEPAIESPDVPDQPDLPDEPDQPNAPDEPDLPDAPADRVEHLSPSESVDTELGASGRRRRGPFVVLAIVVVAVVAVAVAGAAWWSGRTVSNDVPDLALVAQGEALNMISEFGWNVLVVPESDDGIAAGLVIRTDPPSGTTLDEGDDLTLVVSSGPAPRVLPEIVGLTVDQATADLLQLGLVLEVGDRSFSDDVPVDEIVSWSVTDQPAVRAGDTVLPGTPIVVVVSAGPAPRVVPETVGLAAADATAALQAVDLVVDASEEFSADVPVGAVVAQNPDAGTELPPGSTVSIVVSKGPDFVAVPPLAGLDVQAATDALAAAGLGIGQVKGDLAGVNVLAEVGGISIGGGATFPRGTLIDLTFAVAAPAAGEVP